MRSFWLGLLGVGLSQVEVGTAVPSTLQAKDEKGQIISWEKLRGSWVVLFFYPHDDTPGCTRQAKEFSRLLPEFEKQGARVYGVSTQSAESHRAFQKKHGLTVSLLVDEDGKLSDFFGVKRFMGMCSRDIVVINPEGKVALVRTGVSPENSPKEILAWLQSQTSGK